ncbi:MAG: hypothetical protein LBB59_02625 [Campylobacteraceae bacterium]|jgi:hypothetical protein|nr:hypothetical protein [Campylobacteraceae bacterium]
MKKLVTLSLVLALALAVNGCDKKGNGSSNTGTSTSGGYSPEGGERVNGFVLPPYPDPEINDSTLLGIDSNDNGVRDDVERWLIFKYKDHHKIATHIGFQVARASQIVIQDPSKAQETTKVMEAAQACNSYFRNYADSFNEPLLIDHSIVTSTAFKSMQFNTVERIEAYLTYNKKLSGGVYSLPDSIEAYRTSCDFDIDALLGK